MSIIEYNRNSAIEYAKKWALSRNPDYYNFDLLGGDCTNFISQCVFAGSKTMNYTNVTGWYYESASDRTASWTGVEFFYRFITTNTGVGPFAKNVTIANLQLGDVVQLGRSTGEFYHALIVSNIIDGKFFVCAHTRDSLDRPLDFYPIERARFLHIEGVRT